MTGDVLLTCLSLAGLVFISQGMVSLLPCSSHPRTIGNLSGKQKVGRSSVPSCYGATKSTGPRPGQTREVQAKQLQSLPRPLWSGCQRPTCLHSHNVLRKLGTLPRYSSKSCKFFFYLKSPNNSSTALHSISFTGIEFAIFSCSCVCRTRHSSPISAPHTAHTPHKVFPVSSAPLYWRICLHPVSLGPLEPLVVLPHPVVPRAVACQAQKGPGTPLLTSSTTSLTVKLSPVFLRCLLDTTSDRQPQIHR